MTARDTAPDTDRSAQPDAARPLSLREGMRRMVEDCHFLTGAAVAYGTADAHREERLGLAREVRLAEGGTPPQTLPDPRPLTPATLFDIASLTKLFTCVAVFQLIDGGALRLSDTVGGVAPRFRALGDVPLSDALCYEAVLRTPERVDAQPTPEAAEAMVFQTRRVDGEPPRLYSDMNALVLKYVVERAGGMPFEAWLAKHVFAPAGMADTFARVPASRLDDCVSCNLEHRVTFGRRTLDTGALPGVPHDPKARLMMRDGGLCGHAGLFSTLTDMARLCRALLSGRLLSEASLREIGVNRTGRVGPGDAYRQYMGYLCFSKSAVRRLSEVPPWMGARAFGLSGFTGCHVAVDPELGAFDVLLGNRCHNRLSHVDLRAGESYADLGLAADGSGAMDWGDGRRVWSSAQYVYRKDDWVHMPAFGEMCDLGWLR